MNSQFFSRFKSDLSLVSYDASKDAATDVRTAANTIFADDVEPEAIRNKEASINTSEDLIG